MRTPRPLPAGLTLPAVTIGALLVGCGGDVQVGSPRSEVEESPSSPDLAGTVWRVVEFQSMSDEVGILRPDDPSDYTMAFSSDGSVSLTLDCNRGTGTWSATRSSATSGSIAFGPVAGSSARCPPPSMGETIARDLGFVRSYVMEGNRLFLSLMADGGIYVWERAAPGT